MREAETGFVKKPRSKALLACHTPCSNLYRIFVEFSDFAHFPMTSADGFCHLRSPLRRYRSIWEIRREVFCRCSVADFRVSRETLITSRSTLSWWKLFFRHELVHALHAPKSVGRHTLFQFPAGSRFSLYLFAHAVDRESSADSFSPELSPSASGTRVSGREDSRSENGSSARTADLRHFRVSYRHICRGLGM